MLKIKPSLFDAGNPNQGFVFSRDTDEIVPAFIRFQGMLGFAKKNIENTFFEAKYADIKEVWKVIKEPLIENEMAIMQFPTFLPYIEVAIKEMALKEFSSSKGKYQKLIWTGNWIKVSVREVMVTTLLLHESGQYVKSWYSEVPEDNSHHSRGKAITYARRYTLMPILGIAPEDSDGNPVPLDENKKHQDGRTSTTSASSTQPPTTAKDVYIKDSFNVPRYNATKKQLNDIYQEDKGLIKTAQWLNMEALVMQKIGGNIEQFKKWIVGIYSCEFYDLPMNTVAGIVSILQNSPQQIMQYVPQNSK